MLDLQYGLPLNIRDAALKMASTGPTSAINREYHAQNNDGNIAGIDKEQQSKTARELLSRLAKSSGAFNRAADPKIAKGDMNTTGGDSSSRRIEAPPARNDFVNRKKGERTERGLPYARKEASGTMASGYSPRPGPPIDRGETPTKKTKTAAAAASGGESVTASGSDVAPAPSEPGDTPT